MNKIIIFSAPSGAGKTTLVKEMLHKHPEFKLEFSVSACSRKKREGETQGIDYYFISAEDFKNKISNNELIEWQEVYKDSFYGTLKSEIDRIFSKGNNVLFDVDVAGGVNLKNIFKEQALSIFVMPPSIEELEQRLIKRATDNAESIAKRVGKAKHEIEFAPKFDKIVINDNLETAINETLTLLDHFLNKSK